MDKFKKEAEASEKNLSSLLYELDKVAEGQGEWTRPVVAPINVEVAKEKIRGELKKYAASMNGTIKGILSAVFRQVDQPAGSTGDEHVESDADSEGR